mmetsp:Transcript_31811/g.91283  ORF Transcript_31811/g.91283 Transcript_31811/m.91283 type:complete len:280 (-) Transcript_31811:54-893(-)
MAQQLAGHSAARRLHGSVGHCLKGQEGFAANAHGGAGPTVRVGHGSRHLAGVGRGEGNGPVRVRHRREQRAERRSVLRRHLRRPPSGDELLHGLQDCGCRRLRDLVLVHRRLGQGAHVRAPRAHHARRPDRTAVHLLGGGEAGDPEGQVLLQRPVDGGHALISLYTRMHDDARHVGIGVAAAPNVLRNAGCQHRANDEIRAELGHDPPHLLLVQGKLHVDVVAGCKEAALHPLGHAVVRIAQQENLLFRRSCGVRHRCSRRPGCLCHLAKQSRKSRQHH